MFVGEDLWDLGVLSGKREHPLFMHEAPFGNVYPYHKNFVLSKGARGRIEHKEECNGRCDKKGLCSE